MAANTAGKLIVARRFAPLFALFQAGTFNDNALKNALIAMITFGGVAFLSDLPSQVRVPGCESGSMTGCGGRWRGAGPPCRGGSCGMSGTRIG